MAEQMVVDFEFDLGDVVQVIGTKTDCSWRIVGRVAKQVIVRAKGYGGARVALLLEYHGVGTGYMEETRITTLREGLIELCKEKADAGTKD